MSTVFATLARPMGGYAPLGPRVRGAGIVPVLIEWDRRARERARLRRTLPCHLEDMGLTPAFVAAECAKPFWRG